MVKKLEIDQSVRIEELLNILKEIKK